MIDPWLQSHVADASIVSPPSTNANDSHFAYMSPSLSMPMNDSASTLEELKQRMKQFADDRDWQQFHDLKNLSMALAIEAAELMEHFRWVANTNANALMSDADVAAAIRQEAADVLLLLVQFANVAGIDLMAAAQAKLALNEVRYPIDKSRGVATKYDKL
jgi:dCTP diphosphatase